MTLQTAHPVAFSAIQAAAEAHGLNWQALIAWGIKYGESLFLPVVLALIAGNWAAAVDLAAAQGPQCVTDLFAALGITLPVPTP